MKMLKALCMIILAASLVSAQKPLTPAQSNWTSALFTDLVDPSGRLYSLYIEDGDEVVGVDSRTFRFNREKLINFEFCSKSGGKTIEKAPTGYLADRFYRYEIKGRVFAYEFANLTTPKIPIITAPSSKETATGCVNTGRSFVFMDENGDGTFEQNCDRMSLTPLPQWVKDLGRIKVKTANN